MPRTKKDEPLRVTFNIVTPASEMTAQQACMAFLGISLEEYVERLQDEHVAKLLAESKAKQAPALSEI